MATTIAKKHETAILRISPKQPLVHLECSSFLASGPKHECFNALGDYIGQC